MSKLVKSDEGKARLDLIDPLFLADMARVMEYGARKPGRSDHNWRIGGRWGLYLAALLRHVFEWASGESIDAESGCPHLAHAACCLMILLYWQRNRIGTDDRIYPETEKNPSLEKLRKLSSEPERVPSLSLGFEIPTGTPIPPEPAKCNCGMPPEAAKHAIHWTTCPLYVDPGPQNGMAYAEK